MEGEQIQNIALNNSMDVHSNDMLVPIGQPKFQHNRQQFQGQYLPTSVRFEHDGYAAGDCVYDFKIEHYIEGLFISDDIDIAITLYNEPYGYCITFYKKDHNKKKEIGHIFLNLDSFEQAQATTTEGLITFCDVSLHSIPVRVTINNADKICSIDNTAILLDYAFIDKGYIKVTLKYRPTLFNADLTYSMPTDVYDSEYKVFQFDSVEDNIYKYDFNDKVLMYNKNNDSLTYNETPLNHTVVGSNVKAKLSLDYANDASLSIGQEEFIPLINNLGFTKNGGPKYYSYADENENQVLDKDTMSTVLSLDSKYFSKEHDLPIKVYVPLPVLIVASGFGIDYSDKTIFDSTVNGVHYKVILYKDNSTVKHIYGSLYTNQLGIDVYDYKNNIEHFSTEVIGNTRVSLSGTTKVGDSGISRNVNLTFNIDGPIFNRSVVSKQAYDLYIDDELATNENLNLSILENSYTETIRVPVDSTSIARGLKYSFAEASLDLSSSTYDSIKYKQVGQNMFVAFYKGYAYGKVKMLSDYVNGKEGSIIYEKAEPLSNKMYMIDRGNNEIIKGITPSFLCTKQGNDSITSASLRVIFDDAFRVYGPFESRIYIPPLWPEVLPEATMVEYMPSNNLMFTGNYISGKRIKSIFVQLKDNVDSVPNNEFIDEQYMPTFVNGLTYDIPDMNYTIVGQNISGMQTAILHGFINDIHIDYNINGTITIRDSNNNYAMYKGYKINENISKTIDGYNIALSTKFIYNLDFSLLDVNNTIPDVQLADSDSADILYNGKPITLSKNNVKYLDEYFSSTLITENRYHADIDYSEKLDLNIQLKGVFKYDNISDLLDDGNNISFSVDGKPAQISYSDLRRAHSDLLYTYTLVDKDELEDVQIHKEPVDRSYQFLKQQWNTTTEVENYWWIDSAHILVLTNDTLIIKEKTDEISDWNGDVFIDKCYMPRTDFITIIKDFIVYSYGVTSCAIRSDFDTFNSMRFYMIGLLNDTIHLYLFKFDLDDVLVVTNDFTLNIVKHDIGQNLNDNNQVLNTYSDLVNTSILSQAKFSASIVQHKISGSIICLFGIHLDNNYNQWTVQCNLTNNTYHILQGYGFVGVDGSLTGGELPDKYFDINRGFNSAVLPLTLLSSKPNYISNIDDFYSFACGEHVFGTEAQQWYVTQKIENIVSHLTWNGVGWTCHMLPLTSNLSQIYRSGSFAKVMLSDYLPVTRFFTDLFPTFDEGSGDSISPSATFLIGMLNTILITALNPVIFMIAPRVNTWLELQQTLGQYAYVHYNSTSIYHPSDITIKDDNKNDVNTPDLANFNKVEKGGDLTFNRCCLRQHAHTDRAMDKLITFLASFFLSMADFTVSSLVVNTHQNQVSSSDEGKQFSSFFLANVDMLAAADTTIGGQTPSVNSIVAGVLTLDMFYSTANQQKISAGRGYVNHNFVAQCTAQSVTSHQMEFSQVGFNLIIKDVTLFELNTLIKGEQAAYDALTNQANSTKEGQAMASNFGWLAAVALNVAAGIIYAHKLVLETARDVVDKLLTAMGSEQIRVSRTNGKSVHTYDVEGTHKYGSKTEYFMWPCFGIENPTFFDEHVQATTINVPWAQGVQISANYLLPPVDVGSASVSGIKTDSPSRDNRLWLKGDVNYFVSDIIQAPTSKDRPLPNDMASVIGVNNFLPTTPYRNENIGESEPVFTTPPFQDYIIDKQWKLAQTASVGMTTWVSCDDTKLLDGEFSNILVSDTFCGVACPYTAIEVKKGVDDRYIRPWAITPQAIAINKSGFNCCFEHRAYHAFDGQGYRITNWTGAPGMNKEHQTWLYCFLINDRFKRGNKLPQNEFLGNFQSEPETALKGDYNDKVFTLMTQPGENKGLTAGTIGEDKDIRRYAVPVFSEYVSTLPAVVKTISAFTLSTIDGITSLTSMNRDLQTLYKAPLSIDFAIGKDMYRFTQEYICSLQQDRSVSIVKELVPCLGLTFLGSTPYEAYLYSQATRQYYIFSGGTQLRLVDMVERFRNVINGRYDFVNQEVLVPCLATFLRLDKNVYDDENETDNIFIGRLKDGNFIGELTPPIEPIFNTRSWYRLLSLPIGTVFQGPNRCIINRFVIQEYMYDQIKSNYGKWKRVPREEYHPFRKYKENYEWVYKRVDSDIKGWTHNPFLLVTAPLGVNTETDCQFEWEITFAWPIEMDRLYGIDNYATVNIQAQCMTPGGKVVAERPVHVYLTKELFTRTGSYGYYSFRYQSNCGAGNRERLHIWSDQIIAISSLKCAYKMQTQKRTEILTQQVDIQDLKEI